MHHSRTPNTPLTHPLNALLTHLSYPLLMRMSRTRTVLRRGGVCDQSDVR